MSANYHDVFRSDIAEGLDFETIDVIAESRRGRRVLEPRGGLSAREQKAYQKLGQQLVKNVAGRVFDGSVKVVPKLDDDDDETEPTFGYLLALAEGNDHHSFPLMGLREQERSVLNKKLLRELGARNLPEAMFKAVLQQTILVQPPKSAEVDTSLSPLLLEVLALVAQGETTGSIGHRLDNTSTRAGNYIALLLKSTEAITRPQAIYRSFEKGIWPSSLAEPS